MCKFHLFVFDKKQSYEKIFREDVTIPSHGIGFTKIVTDHISSEFIVGFTNVFTEFTFHVRARIAEQNRVQPRCECVVAFLYTRTHSYSSNRRQVNVVDNRLLSTDAYPSKKKHPLIYLWHALERTTGIPKFACCMCILSRNL